MRISTTVVSRAVLAAACLLPHSSFACAVCYGAPNSAMTKGLNMGILVLLGVTGVVLGGFLTFIVYLARRARKFEHEQLDLELLEKERA